MGSKYATVSKGLPPLPVQPKDQPYQDRVEEEKRRMRQDVASPDFPSLYWACKIKVARAKLALSAEELKLTAAHQLIVSSYEAEMVESKRLITGQLIGVHPEPTPAFTEDDGKETFRLWCLANGYERSMHLSHGTTSTILKDALIAGQPPPPGIKAFVRQKITCPKPKPAELVLPKEIKHAEDS